MLIAGVDEAGRGPLAGPVIAAAVILPLKYDLPNLNDSKLLTAKTRNILYDQIQAIAIAWAVGCAEVAEIDKLNILQATLLAMQRAVEKLIVLPQKILVDGLQVPRFSIAAEAICHGDALIPAISAASIMAKVTRDAQMQMLHHQYPQYGFASHKGYGTEQHLKALREHGPCPLHRRSFKPVRDAEVADV